MGSGPRHEEAAGGDEFVFELGAVFVGEGAGGVWRAGELEVAGVEVGLAGGRGHGFEDAVLQVEVLWDGAFEDGQGAGDGDVVVDEEFDECGGVGAVGVHVGEGGVAGGAGAEVGLFAGVVLGVDEEAVLEVVDAGLGGFGVGDGAEVAGDFEAVLVGGVDGGFELGAGDVHVGLVAGDALRGPVVDEVAGVVGAGEVVHLDEGAVGAFEIGRGDVHVRAEEMAGVDLAAEVEVEVGLDGAGGADGGDAGGEVHARGGEGHLGDDEGWLGGAVGGFVGAGDVVEVVVHADEAGDDGVAVEVDDLDLRLGHCCSAVVSVEMLVILPFSMRMDWSSRGAAPVPSMMRTWVRRIAGALTLTYLVTAGERVGVWA